MSKITGPAGMVATLSLIDISLSVTLTWVAVAVVGSAAAAGDMVDTAPASAMIAAVEKVKKRRIVRSSIN
jgi:hypothetical protein